jgi:hypothetical protein
MYDQHDCCNILQKKVDANASLASAWRRHCIYILDIDQFLQINAGRCFRYNSQITIFDTACIRNDLLFISYTYCSVAVLHFFITDAVSG